jgi:long-chain acyl-CoA synthetase
MLRSAGAFDGYLGSTSDDVTVVDREGFLATGDYAEVDPDGFIRLVGRKSEIFKTSTGRRVAPSAVEAALRRAPGVEHAAVFGAGRKSLLAVVVVDHVPIDLPSLRASVRRHLQDLPEYLHPAGLVVTQQPFSIEGGELTGNLKLRRHAVGEGYARALEALAALVDGHGLDDGVAHELDAAGIQLVAL